MREVESLLGRAHVYLSSTRLLHEAGDYESAVSRAYYAMFYAVLAVLATKGLGSSKHSGVISLFDREFVKPGDLPKELSRSLHMAFEHRQQADYGEFAQLDEPEAIRVIQEADTFVQNVQAYIKAKGFLSSM